MGVTIAEMSRRFEKFNLIDEAADIMQQHEQELADYNRMQLYKGLDADGNFLSPKYSEDPFFKSKESAARYAQWKKDITPDPDRPLDVPNLFINGYYHFSIIAVVRGNVVEFVSNNAIGDSIKRKYKRANGLTDESIQKYRGVLLFPLLVRRIAAKTGVGIK